MDGWHAITIIKTSGVKEIGVERTIRRNKKYKFRCVRMFNWGFIIVGKNEIKGEWELEEGYKFIDVT